MSATYEIKLEGVFATDLKIEIVLHHFHRSDKQVFGMHLYTLAPKMTSFRKHYCALRLGLGLTELRIRSNVFSSK